MSIETAQRERFQIIRFTTDAITDSDIMAIKTAVGRALAEGTKEIVFSVDVGSLSNQLVVSRLILHCSEAIRRLHFVERHTGERSVFGTICESLHIPMHNREEEIEKKTMAELVSP